MKLLTIRSRIIIIVLIISFILSIQTTIVNELYAEGVETPVNDELSESIINNESNISNIAPEYDKYILGYANIVPTNDEIIIEADSFDKTDDFAGEILNNYENCEGNTVRFPDSGEVTYRFVVGHEGLYNLSFKYFIEKSGSSSIIRDILVDKTMPFKQSAEVSFDQIWQNSNGNNLQFDSIGNEIRSTQTLKNIWTDKPVMDSSGYYTESLKYYLSSGEHTITIVSLREKMALRSLRLYQEKKLITYNQVLDEYNKSGYQTATEKAKLFIEAESATAKSDQTMYSLSDRTSPSVSPYSYRFNRYNTIGGSQWQKPGQWIEWEIDVKESGLYNFGFHFKQSLKVNDISSRELYIDGKLPFAEAADMVFFYNGVWQSNAYSSPDGVPYKFYFTKGIHTIRLKATMGMFSDVLAKAKSELAEMNRIYRKIVVITGTNPDQYRDYQFEKQIPDVLSSMTELSKSLKSLENQIRTLNKSGGQSTAALRRLFIQLDQMNADSETIAYRLTNFKDNISSFGTWMNDMIRQPLELDALYLLPVGSSLPKGEASAISMFKHYILQFLSSFITDYASVGITNADLSTKIRVWTISGIDQSQILKQMINDNFTDEHDIAVNLQLVSPTALMPSIVSGRAPDIFMGLTQAEPINMAMRNALVDLRQFSDFDTISNRFYSNAIVPFKFMNGVYALPDTMSYPMLFYRKDILDEMNISLESLSTWESILTDVLPELQMNSLSVGIMANIQNYVTFLYQNNGTLYIDDGKKSGLNTPEAIKAMEKYSMLYSQYGVPLAFDFANRFRTGDMPVCVTDFMMYNQLTVFAPEIKGLWGMLPVPGTLQNDNTINHSTVATATGSVILGQTNHAKEAWEYLKWWTSMETQQQYGENLESVIGVAARYNSANIEAMSKVQWDYNIKKNLLLQLEYLKPFPEVPGGYLTNRHFDFAFRYIVYDRDDVRETLSDAVFSIDREIANKRLEYHLD